MLLQHATSQSLQGENTTRFAYQTHFSILQYAVTICHISIPAGGEHCRFAYQTQPNTALQLSNSVGIMKKNL